MPSLTQRIESATDLIESSAAEIADSAATLRAFTPRGEYIGNTTYNLRDLVVDVDNDFGGGTNLIYVLTCTSLTSTNAPGELAAGQWALYQYRIPYFATIEDLLAADPGIYGNVAHINGYHTFGDGGGGFFTWDAGGDQADHNGGTVIDPGATFPTDWTNQTQLTTWFSAGSGTGVWRRQYTESINAKWFGAKGDGTTDDTKALQAGLDFGTSVASPLFMPPGLYGITSELVIGDGSGVFSNCGSYFVQTVSDIPDGTDIPVIKWIGSAQTNSCIIRASKEDVGNFPYFAISGPDISLKGIRISGIVLDGNDTAEFGLYSVRASWGSYYGEFSVVRTKVCGIYVNEWYMGSMSNVSTSLNRGRGIMAGYNYFGWDPADYGGNTVSIVDNFNLNNVTAWANGLDQDFDMSPVTTTGSITSGSKTLSVASASGLVIGQPIKVSDALGGNDLEGIIASISGTDVTLSVSATSTVSGKTVEMSRKELGAGVMLYLNRCADIHNILSGTTDGIGIIIAPRSGPGSYKALYPEYCNLVDNTGSYNASSNAVTQGRTTRAYGMMYYNRENTGSAIGDSQQAKLLDLFFGNPNSTEQWLFLTGDFNSSGFVEEPSAPVVLDGTYGVYGIEARFSSYELRNDQSGVTANASRMIGCLPRYGDIDSIQSGSSTLYVGSTQTGLGHGKDSSNRIGGLFKAFQIAERCEDVVTLECSGQTFSNININNYKSKKRIIVDGNGSGTITSTGDIAGVTILECVGTVTFKDFSSITSLKTTDASVILDGSPLAPTSNGTNQPAILANNSSVYVKSSSINCNSMTTSKRGVEVNVTSQVSLDGSTISNFDTGYAAIVRNGGGTIFTEQSLTSSDCTFDDAGAVYTPTAIILKSATK